MNDPRFQRFADGEAVRFTQEAKDAMIKSSYSRQPLRTPAGGADAVYHVDNTDDPLHDFILRENGERWGAYWLEAAGD